jgi:hypothetical protein
MFLRISCLLLALLVGTAPADSAPRPLSAAEDQAIRLVAQVLQNGPQAWWDNLSSDAPLRHLGQKQALQEISVRLGSTQGVRWRLLTPAAHLGSAVALFDIEYATGFTETLLLELVDDSGWKIRQVRSLVDPLDPVEPQPLLATLGPLRTRLTEPKAPDPRNLFRAPQPEGAAQAQALWEAQYHLQHHDDQKAAGRLETVVGGNCAPLGELLTARLAVLRGHGLAMEKAYARLLKRGFDHDGLRLEMAQSQLRMGRTRNLGQSFRKLVEMGSRQSEVAYGMARFAGNDVGDVDSVDHVGSSAAAAKAQGGGRLPLPSLARFSTASNDLKIRLASALLELPAGLGIAAEDLNLLQTPTPTPPPISETRTTPRVGLAPPKPEPLPRITEAEVHRRRLAINAWHQSYSQQVEPVKIALGPIIGAIRGGRPTHMGSTCRTLVDHLTPLLSNSEVFAAPELKIESELRSAFYHFQKMAGACLQGRLSEIRAELVKAETSLRTAAVELQKYGLRP